MGERVEQDAVKDGDGLRGGKRGRRLSVCESGRRRLAVRQAAAVFEGRALRIVGLPNWLEQPFCRLAK